MNVMCPHFFCLYTFLFISENRQNKAKSGVIAATSHSCAREFPVTAQTGTYIQLNSLSEILDLRVLLSQQLSNALPHRKLRPSIRYS